MSVRVTILGVAFESPVDHLLKLWRDCGIDFARRDGMAGKPFGEIFALKGQSSRQHLI